MCVKNHQQAPPHLVLCSSSSKVLRTKRVHLLDLKRSAYRLFQASPQLVNFRVSTKVSWVIEKWNSLDSNLLTAIMLKTWVFIVF
jgi:hypothetical protein